jgi:hypothetical protein
VIVKDRGHGLDDVGIKIHGIPQPRQKSNVAGAPAAEVKVGTFDERPGRMVLDHPLNKGLGRQVEDVAAGLQPNNHISARLKKQVSTGEPRGQAEGSRIRTDCGERVRVEGESNHLGRMGGSQLASGSKEGAMAEVNAIK